jgi:hypothetical protein
MHNSVLEFVRSVLVPTEVRGKRVLEVGAFDVNGSVRPHIEALGPSLYLGTDMRPGPRVDLVVAAEALLNQFGPEAFDLVISTEMLEHARLWRVALANMMQVTAGAGVLILTTRSAGFPRHGFPEDWWRFELEDMRQIFAAWEPWVESDPLMPGVFVKAWRPRHWVLDTVEITRLALVEPGRPS